MKIALGSKVPEPGPYTAPVATESMPPSLREAEGISIVLPARDEVANIVAAVERSLAVAQQLASRCEVIVVDDGSSDGTGQAVEALAKQHPNVRLVSHPTNQGYGAALRTGFAQARFELVFFTDSDNQFDVAELENFMPLMANYDLVAGFRINRDDPVIRFVYSWFYNRFVGILFGLRVRDVNCAFKLMRRQVAEQITIECNNFFVNTELLAKARRGDFRIAEVGVHHYPRTAGQTTVRLSDIPRTMGTALTMWRRIHFPEPVTTNRPGVQDSPVSAVSEFQPAHH